MICKSACVAGVKVKVGVNVAVKVAVDVAVGVRVAVAVRVAVGVLVFVAVEVEVYVEVGPGGALVRVNVGATVMGTLVRVAVFCAVEVRMNVAVETGVLLTGVEVFCEEFEEVDVLVGNGVEDRKAPGVRKLLSHGGLVRMEGSRGSMRGPPARY